MRRWFLAACMLAITGPASAEMTAAQYLELYRVGGEETRNVVEVSLADIATGFMWANITLETDRKEGRLYCPPDRKMFTGAELAAVMRRFVTIHPGTEKMSGGLVLLLGLQREYPCF